MNDADFNALTRHWIDRNVLVHGDHPELRRFHERMGRVMAINKNGRLLVQFQDWADRAWYDIAPEAVRLADATDERVLPVARPHVLAPDDLNPAPGLITRFRNLLWGHDFFIAYQWKSGGAYAVGLAQRLRTLNYDVFLDRADYAGGDDLVRVGSVALRNTKRLVVVATRGAVTESDPVRRELEIFAGTGRQIIPIVFDDRLEDLDREKHPALSHLPASRLFINDSASSLVDGPSENTISELTRTHFIMRRRNTRAMLTLLPAIIIAAFAAVATFQWRDALVATDAAENARDSEQGQRLAAEANLKRANSANEHLVRAVLHSDVREATALVRSENFLDSLPWLAKALKTASSHKFLDSRLHRIRLASALRECPSLRQAFRLDSRRIGQIGLSPSGKWLITDADGKPSQIQLWASHSPESVGKAIAHDGYVRDVQFSRDEQYSLIRTDKAVFLLETSTGARVVIPQVPLDTAQFATISSSGTHLIAQDQGGRVVVFDLSGRFGAELFSLMEFGPLEAADVNVRGTRMVLTSDSKAVVVALTKGGSELSFDLEKAIGSAVSPDGETFLVLEKAGLLKRIELDSSKEVHVQLQDFPEEPRMHPPPRFSIDRTQILVTYGTLNIGGIDVWDTDSGKKVSPKGMFALGGIGTLDVTNPFAFLGCTGITTDGNRDASIWYIRSGHPPFMTLRHTSYASDVAFGNVPLVASGSYDGIARIWDLADGAKSANSIALDARVEDIWIDGEFALLLTARDAGLQVVDARSGDLLWTTDEWKPDSKPSFSDDGLTVEVGTSDAMRRRVAWAPHEDSRRPTSAGLRLGGKHRDFVAKAPKYRIEKRNAGEIRLFSSESNELVATIPVDAGAPPIGAVEPSLSPDGGKLAVWTADGIDVWNIEPAKPLFSVSHQGASVEQIAWSADGRKLATATNEEVLISSITTGESVSSRMVHTVQSGSFGQIQFSPDSAILLTTAGGTLGLPGSEVQLWDAATGEAVIRPIKSKMFVKNAGLNPGHDFLVTVYESGPPFNQFADTVEVQDLSLGELRADECVALATLISCRRIDEQTGGLVHVSASEWWNAWCQWKTRLR